MCVSSCCDDDVESTRAGAGGVCAGVFECEAEFVVVWDEGCHLGEGHDVEAPVAGVGSEDALGVEVFVESFYGLRRDSWVAGTGRGRAACQTRTQFGWILACESAGEAVVNDILCAGDTCQRMFRLSTRFRIDLQGSVVFGSQCRV